MYAESPLGLTLRIVAELHRSPVSIVQKFRKAAEQVHIRLGLPSPKPPQGDNGRGGRSRAFAVTRCVSTEMLRDPLGSLTACCN